MPSTSTSRASGGTSFWRRLPIWLWGVVGFVLLALAVVALSLLWPRDAGYTLELVVSPRGSDVFVDGVRRGVPTADGKIRVENLKAGKRILSVTHEGYKDFNDSVTFDAREVESRTVELVSLSGTPAPRTPTTLPREIEYNGAMALVTAGEFIMGVENESADERPSYRATLPAFYIDKYEVTNKEYREFCEAKPHPTPLDPSWQPGYFRNRAQAPVVGVDWEDAEAYCADWAKKRLPTEEEWEKAASWDENTSIKEKQKRKWPWGNEAEAGHAVIGRGLCCPSEVGKSRGDVSAYGVHDMAGNVGEWVNDLFRPYQATQGGNRPPDSGERVARGCAFNCDLNNARTTRRSKLPPRFTEEQRRRNDWAVGFRCAVSADDVKLQEHLRGR